MPRIFVGEPFNVSLISGAAKVWIREEGLSRYSVENYLSHSAEKFRGWRKSFWVSFILGIDKVWTRGEGGSIKTCAEIFLSHSAEKVREGTLYSFTNFGYGKIFLLQRLCHDFEFAVHFFVSQCRKTS